MRHAVLRKNQRIPAHKETPLDAHPDAGLQIRYGSIFAHHDHLVLPHDGPQNVVDVLATCVVHTTGVTVVADYVDF